MARSWPARFYVFTLCSCIAHGLGHRSQCKTNAFLRVSESLLQKFTLTSQGSQVQSLLRPPLKAPPAQWVGGVFICLSPTGKPPPHPPYAQQNWANQSSFGQILGMKIRGMKLFGPRLGTSAPSILKPIIAAPSMLSGAQVSSSFICPKSFYIFRTSKTRQYPKM